MTPNESSDPSSQQQASEDQSLGSILRRLGPAAYLGIAWAVFPAVAGIALLKNRKEASEFLLSFTGNDGSNLIAGVLLFCGLFILTAGIGVLPTYAQAIIAGYVFGIQWGFPAALVGITGAALIGYMIALTIARKRVEGEIHKHPKAEIVRDAFVRHGFWRALGVLILLRVSPSSPFSLMNGLMAVSGVRVLPYAIATLVGMAPRTFAAVWIGNSVTNWDKYDKPTWLVVAGVVLMIAVLVILGQLANKAIEKAMGPESGGLLNDPQPDPESGANATE